MRKAVLILAVFAAGAAAQTLDLSALDKLEKIAKEANTVTLDAGQIRGAMNIMGLMDSSDKDAQSVRSILGGIKSLAVRNFEFAEKGQYPPQAVESVRAQMAKMPGWTRIVESRSAEEHNEVYLLTQSEKVAGIAVISTEPREVTVVYINGSVNLSDLRKLHGEFGIPDVDVQGHDAPKKD
jgi:hypothetical protein